jgi:hypothetical protein
MNLEEKLLSYDQCFYEDLEAVLEKIRSKSKALASNLKECITAISKTDRYLRAYRQENIAIREKDLKGEEFMIFRKYVRLLRSCTILCGQESSSEFKKYFLDFFSGTRIDLARKLGKQSEKE